VSDGVSGCYARDTCTGSKSLSPGKDSRGRERIFSRESGKILFSREKEKILSGRDFFFSPGKGIKFYFLPVLMHNQAVSYWENILSLILGQNSVLREKKKIISRERIFSRYYFRIRLFPTRKTTFPRIGTKFYFPGKRKKLFPGREFSPGTNSESGCFLLGKHPFLVLFIYYL
jgi:hypothetical protein